MINRVYRAHPLDVLRYLKPYLFILILPLLRGGVQYLVKQTVSGVLIGELILLALILIISAGKTICFSISVSADKICVRRGILLVNEAVLPVDSVATVHLTRGPLDYIFSSAAVSINTEAGRVSKPDFEFRLSYSHALQLAATLAGTPPHKTVKYSFLKILAMSAATSSAFTGLIIGVPVINKIGKLVNVGLSQRLLEEINVVSNRYAGIVPPVVNAVTIFFILCYSLSLINTLLKMTYFRVQTGDDILMVSSGLISRETVAFHKSDVNSICIEQAPVMRLFNRYSLRVSIGGYVSRRGESATIVPIGTRGEVKNRQAFFFPYVSVSGKRIRPGKGSMLRFLYLPTVAAMLLTGVCAALAMLFPYFDQLIIFTGISILAVIIYWYGLCIYNCRFGKIRFGDTVYMRSTRKFTTCELCCDTSKIGEIRIVRKLAADRIHGTCNVRVIMRSRNADALTVRHVPYDELRRNVFETFGIKDAM